MPITPKNNWLNILDKLTSIFRTEFGNTLPIYVGHDKKNVGGQYIRIEPSSSALIEQTKGSEKREFTVNMFYYSFQKNIEPAQLENVLRVTSRIEALVHDNINITLADSTVAYNCSIESTELDVLEDEDKYVVQFNWQCVHLGNLS